MLLLCYCYRGLLLYSTDLHFVTYFISYSGSKKDSVTIASICLYTSCSRSIATTRAADTIEEWYYIKLPVSSISLSDSSKLLYFQCWSNQLQMPHRWYYLTMPCNLHGCYLSVYITVCDSIHANVVPSHAAIKSIKPCAHDKETDGLICSSPIIIMSTFSTIRCSEGCILCYSCMSKQQRWNLAVIQARDLQID